MRDGRCFFSRRGAPRACREFLCGAYWLDHGHVHRYLRSLPDVITVSPDYDRSPHLRLLTDLLSEGVSDTGPGTEATRPALLDLILTHVLRQWLEQNPAADRPMPSTGRVSGRRLAHRDASISGRRTGVVFTAKCPRPGRACHGTIRLDP
ncbi:MULTISPECIES: cupin domain-containing protein [unclassified Streptomyces]|uniref:cupin domain-containing protein n=1 Tax=unclassified Streptomyces TaxID=2593676 RepID=UPI0036E3EEB6